MARRKRSPAKKPPVSYDQIIKSILQKHEDPQIILKLKSPGLAPLLPLMAGNPKELVQKAQDKIKKAPENRASTETKRELLTALNVLAGSVIRDKIFLRRIISEIGTMGENYVVDYFVSKGKAIGLLEGKKKGLKEGHYKGTRDEARKGILKVLTKRFGIVPKDLPTKLAGVKELNRLEDLLVEAAVCKDLKAFLRGLG
ncbi:MAG: hypothetical protein HY717_21420 [Planctomycetes bacterium]|nr:hypothetical protein [Planctomycetota bacterium]